MKKKCLLLVLALVMQLLLPSCANEKSDSVSLKWYIVGSEQKDLGVVNEELNKHTMEKIGATVELVQLSWSAYSQKMNVLTSTGDEFDLCWTAPQNNDYYSNVSKGAFIPLDELLDQYAPKTKAAVPDEIWEATRINGKIYGIINYQIMATGYGYAVQREMADAAGFDWAGVKTYKDLEPMLEYIKGNYPDKIPLSFTKTSDSFSKQLPTFGMEAIGAVKIPGAVYLDDAAHKVINQYESEAFKEFITVMRDWYQKGYLKTDAATSEEYQADKTAGKFGVLYPSYLADDTTDYDYFPDQPYDGTGKPYYRKKLTPNYITNDRALATMTAISKTSKNPEKAMELIELINTDAEVYNLLCWGIKGKHWEPTDETDIEGRHILVKPIKDSGYNPNTPWMFGNTENLWLDNNYLGPNYWKPINDAAIKSSILGFAFNSENVTNEIAACSAVLDEYLPTLTSGGADVESKYPEFIEKLKAAGADKIIAEKQTQLDAWLAAK